MKPTTVTALLALDAAAGGRPCRKESKRVAGKLGKPFSQCMSAAPKLRGE